MDEFLVVIIFALLSYFFNKDKKPASGDDTIITDLDLTSDNTTGQSTQMSNCSECTNTPDEVMDALLQIAKGTYKKKRKKKVAITTYPPKESYQQSMLPKPDNIIPEAPVLAQSIQMPTKSDEQQDKLDFQRNDILKAFVMKELMQRYDINRIYERIPAFKIDE